MRFLRRTGSECSRARRSAARSSRHKGTRKNQQAVDAMKKRGLQVHPVNAEEEAEWRRFSEGIYPKFEADRACRHV